jgi:hypothetical protein
MGRRRDRRGHLGLDVSVRTAARAGRTARLGADRSLEGLERERVLAEVEVAERRRLFD